ncbi:MAG: hypothetical protein ABJG04_03415, partial [Roseobacter sp.]
MTVHESTPHLHAGAFSNSCKPGPQVRPADPAQWQMSHERVVGVGDGATNEFFHLMYLNIAGRLLMRSLFSKSNWPETKLLTNQHNTQY